MKKASIQISSLVYDYLLLPVILDSCVLSMSLVCDVFYDDVFGPEPDLQDLIAESRYGEESRKFSE